MSIIRRGAPLNRNFYILDKAISEDSRLSFEARGLLIFLLGKPDTWQVSIQHLVNESPAGKDKIARMLKELRTVGYITCERQHGEKGKIAGFIYTVFEFAQPQPENPDMDKPQPEKPVMDKPQPEKPDAENPEPVKPATANPLLVSTDINQELSLVNTNTKASPSLSGSKKTNISFNREDHDFSAWSDAGITDQVIDRWLLNRQTKNNPVSPLDISKNLKEVVIAKDQFPDLSINSLMTECVIAGWALIKSEWIFERLKIHENKNKEQDHYLTAEASMQRLTDTSWGEDAPRDGHAQN